MIVGIRMNRICGSFTYVGTLQRSILGDYIGTGLYTKFINCVRFLVITISMLSYFSRCRIERETKDNLLDLIDVTLQLH